MSEVVINKASERITIMKAEHRIQKPDFQPSE
jgi:hypothetical protein